jgi:uncharacterized protein YjiS (DUF1127 family)
VSAVPEIREDNAFHQLTEQFRIASKPAARLSTMKRLGQLWTMLMIWQQKRAGRRALRDLTDSELLDIGVSRAEAGKEIAKSFFWD